MSDRQTSTCDCLDPTAPPFLALSEPQLKITLSDDQMSAHLEVVVEPESTATAIPLEQVITAMTAVGLPAPSFDDLSKLIGGYELRLPIQAPIIVARGEAPIDDTPARLEMLLHEESAGTEKVVDHYNRHHYVTAVAGEAIARVHRRIAGSAGMDVCGKSISQPHPPDQRFTLGANVTLEADGTVVSRIAGRVRNDNEKLWVDPLMDIPGDVNFAVGNIDFSGDVNVCGSVLDLFRVASNGNVTIQGAVEAAEIIAGANLVVRGGIVGKDRGHCTAKENITFKFAINAKICAGGDIHAQVEIASSQVRCGGQLDIRDGLILGGEVQARGGVRCGTLGTSAGTKTIVEVGTDPPLRHSLHHQLSELKRLQKEIHDVCEDAVPMLQNQKSLNATQKEDVTELLFQKSQAEIKAAKILSELREAFEATRAAAKEQVLVMKCIYPGVTLRFPDLECTIDQALRGPLQFAPRKIDGCMVICAIQEDGRYGLPLHTRPMRDELMHAVMHALGITPATQQ
jgi:uncharacterized protein (DUF342 family)